MTRDDASEACVSSESEIRRSVASRPADVVWLLDASGSMQEEIDAVQAHLNAFARRFAASSVDARLVVIATSAEFQVPSELRDDERFLFVNQWIESGQPFRKAVQYWPFYRDFLRKDALIHYVVVSDDDDKVVSDCFLEEIGALVGSERAVRVHTVSSNFVERDTEPSREDRLARVSGCDTGREYFKKNGTHGACETATNAGLQYYEAAKATGGVALSICSPNWESIFAHLGDNVEEASVGGCVMNVPAPPDGRRLDIDKARVVRVQGEVREELLRVDSETACQTGGWYFDDPANPGEAILCSQTCDAFAQQGAQVSLELGCAWVLR